MRRLDWLHLEFPFAALYHRPRTSKREHGHKIYPYLLRGMAITRPSVFT